MSKQRVFVVVAGVLIILVGVALFLGQQSQRSNSTPSGKTTEGPEALLSGFEQISNQGATSTQLSELKYAIGQFTDSHHIQAKTIVVGQGSVHNEPLNPSRPRALDFALSIDNQDYSARMETDELTTMRLQLFDPKTGKQVYDSGVVDQSGGD